MPRNMLVAEELQLGSFLKYLGQYLRSGLEREQYEGAEADPQIPSWWKGLAIRASSRGREGGKRTRSGVCVCVCVCVCSGRGSCGWQ